MQVNNIQVKPFRPYSPCDDKIILELTLESWKAGMNQTLKIISILLLSDSTKDDQPG